MVNDYCSSNEMARADVAKTNCEVCDFKDFYQRLVESAVTLAVKIVDSRADAKLI